MTHFYKYVTAETGKKILKYGTLRWSTPPTLNDPFDMQFAFQLRYDPEIVQTMTLEKRWQLYSGDTVDRPIHDAGKLLRCLRKSPPLMTREELDEAFRDVAEQCIQQTKATFARRSRELLEMFSNDKIFCISKVPDSILMWSYYAQNHAGLVLRFTDEVPGGAIGTAKPVQYVEHIPSLFSNETFSDALAGYDALDRQKILDAIVLTKSSHWAHEREWRIYVGSGRSDAAFEDIPFIPNELDGVIFGMRMVQRHRTTVMRLLEEKLPHVEALQATAKPDAYELAILPYTRSRRRTASR
jgi:hypothetical protein